MLKITYLFLRKNITVIKKQGLITQSRNVKVKTTLKKSSRVKPKIEIVGPQI
jgi:hypothetical protein